MIFSLRNKISTQILNRSYIFAIIQAYFLWGHTSRHKGLQPEDRPFRTLYPQLRGTKAIVKLTFLNQLSLYNDFPQHLYSRTHSIFIRGEFRTMQRKHCFFLRRTYPKQPHNTGNMLQINGKIFPQHKRVHKPHTFFPKQTRSPFDKIRRQIFMIYKYR